jgi:hypothetical protein
LLIHQLPPKPSSFRVKIWRRLQKLGAIALKGSVYILPRSEAAHKDLQWVLREILAGSGEVRFDMFEAEFTHEGDCCTFEVLLTRCGLDDPALRDVAEIVHEIDLKDRKFGRPESDGIAAVVAGIAQAHREHEDRLQRGAALFDDLFHHLRRRRRP